MTQQTTHRTIELNDEDKVTVVTGDEDGDVMLYLDTDTDGLGLRLTVAQARELIGVLATALHEIGA